MVKRMERDYQAVIDALRDGDSLMKTGRTWSLMRANRNLAHAIVDRLLSSDVGLQPNRDCLPTFGADLSQTWTMLGENHVSTQ